MSKKVNDIRRNLSGSNVYREPLLGSIVTRSECEALWGRATTTIDMQIAKGNLDARKSVTGGTVLISVKSIVALWGLPDDYAVWECFDGSFALITVDLFRSEITLQDNK